MARKPLSRSGPSNGTFLLVCITRMMTRLVLCAPAVFSNARRSSAAGRSAIVHLGVHSGAGVSASDSDDRTTTATRSMRGISEILRAF